MFDIYFGSHFFKGPNMVKAMTMNAMAGNEDCPINLVGMEDDASESSVVAVEEKNASTEKNDQEEHDAQCFGGCGNIIVELGLENMNHFLTNSDGTSLETDRSCASKVSSLDAGPLSITFDHENLSLDGLTLNSADFEIEPDTNLAEEILSSLGDISKQAGSEEQIETIQTEQGLFLIGISVKKDDQPELKKVPSYDTEDTAPESRSSSGSSSNASLAEATKKVVQVAGRTLEYKHRNQEINKLKLQIDNMKQQAKVMKLEADTLFEKLRRSTETKRDLVLVQQEWEKIHEDCLAQKDKEIETLKEYIRLLEQNVRGRTRILHEKRAEHDLKFMNEINALITSHKAELDKKNQEISHLKLEVTSLKSHAVTEITV